MDNDRRRIGIELRSTTNLFKRKIVAQKPPELEESTGIHGFDLKFFYDIQNCDIFQKDFAAHFSIRRSTATNMLKLMETNGLILREPVPYDARLKKIILTEKAIALHKQIEQHIALSENVIRKGITPEELEVFFSVIDKIKNNLEELE